MELMSTDISKLATALSKFQGCMESIPKTKPVKIPTKSGGTFTFHFADLATITDSIKTPLLENELSICQTFCPVEKNGMIVTTLMHSSGQWIRSFLPLNFGLQQKELGADITYYRRYSLSAILGICTDDDNDVGEPAEEKQTAKEDVSQPKVETLNVSEVDEIRFLIQDHPEIREEILKVMKKKSFSEIPRFEFRSIVARIHVLLKKTKAA